MGAEVKERKKTKDETKKTKDETKKTHLFLISFVVWCLVLSVVGFLTAYSVTCVQEKYNDDCGRGMGRNDGQVLAAMAGPFDHGAVQGAVGACLGCSLIEIVYCCSDCYANKKKANKLYTEGTWHYFCIEEFWKVAHCCEKWLKCCKPNRDPIPDESSIWVVLCFFILNPLCPIIAVMGCLISVK